MGCESFLSTPSRGSRCVGCTPRTFSDLAQYLTFHCARYQPQALRKLDLRKNLLHTLGPGQFDMLASLKQLFLHENSIYRIKEGSFKGMPLLKDLYLHRNSIEALESASVFDELPAVDDLDLDLNPMSKKCVKGSTKHEKQVGVMKAKVSFCCCVDGGAIAAKHKAQEEAAKKADAEFDASIGLGSGSGMKGRRQLAVLHETMTMSTSMYHLFVFVLIVQFGVIGCLWYKLSGKSGEAVRMSRSASEPVLPQ